MELKFHTLDVFTRTRFGGNPLAVVLEADDLTTEQRRLVLALVEAAKDAPGRRPEAGHPHGDPMLA